MAGGRILPQARGGNQGARGAALGQAERRYLERGGLALNDVNLRDLERRWQASCSPEEEAALLMGLCRSGQLTRDRIELIAHCGNPGAIAVIGAPPTRVLQDWCRTFAVWGREAAVRVLVAAIAPALPVLEEEFPGERRPAQLLGAIEAWIRDPCSSKREAVYEHHTFATWTQLLGGWREAEGVARPDAPARVTGALADAAFIVLMSEAHLSLFSPREVENGLMKVIPLAGEERVRAAILKALLPWALGWDVR